MNNTLKNNDKARKAGRPSNPVQRSELLAIARAMFAEIGYSATSMGEIAERAGLRKASLFHHFSTKRQLYMEVLGDVLRDLDRLISEVSFEGGDFAKRLDHLGELVIEYLGSRQDTSRLLLREALDRGPFMGGGGFRTVQQTLEVIAAFLKSGMHEGVVAEQDARQLALSIVGLHILYFAVGDVSARFVGKDIFSPEILEARKREIRSQVRSLCGLPRE